MVRTAAYIAYIKYFTLGRNDGHRVPALRQQNSGTKFVTSKRRFGNITGDFLQEAANQRHDTILTFKNAKMT